MFVTIGPINLLQVWTFVLSGSIKGRDIIYTRFTLLWDGDPVYRENFTDNFYDWMVRTGRPAKRTAPGQKEKKPTLGMKESTARDYQQRISRLLAFTDPPYLNANVISRRNGTNGQKVDRKWLSGDKIDYTVARNIQLINVREMVSGIHALFPTVDDSVVPNYRHFQQAGVVFIRYLIWEKTNKHGRPVLKDQDMKTWREEVPSLSVKSIPTLEIVDPELIDDFLIWLEKEDRELWGPTWAMRNLGLRYSGMRTSTVDLNGGPRKEQGSLKLSITRKYTRQGGERVLVEKPHLTIWEKQRPREFDLAKKIAEFLLDQQKYQRENHPESKALFTNKYGNQFHLQSGPYNAALQRAYVRFHRDVFSEDPPENEVKVMTAHKLRHACGVALVRMRMPEKLIRDIMGHMDQKTLDRYIQHVRDDLSDMWDNALDGNGNGSID